MKKKDKSPVRLSELLEPGIGYFGMELFESPRSKEFRQSCIRTPDIICRVGESCWLVLWKSWENGISIYGTVEREGDHYPIESVPGCSKFLPLSIVLHCLVLERRICAMDYIAVIAAEPLASAGCADVRWDVPRANLSFLKFQTNGGGQSFRLYTPEQLDARYSNSTLTLRPLLRIPPERVAEQARSFLNRAERIATLMANSEADYRALRHAYEEAILYGDALLRCVPHGSASDELWAVSSRASHSFSSIIFHPWYAGSALQREQHPAGLVILRFVGRVQRCIYDFTPNRRWTLHAGGDWAHLRPAAADSAEALPYDPATGCHALPPDASYFIKLGSEALRDVYL